MFTGFLKLRMSHIFSVSSPRKQRGSVGVNSRPSDLKRRRHFLHLPPHSARLFNTAARVTFIYIREKCSKKDPRVELLLFVSERLPCTPTFCLETDSDSICTQGGRERDSRILVLRRMCMAPTMQRKISSLPPREARVTPS